MIEISSTPIVLMAILGTIGVAIPVISIARKETGSNSFYAAIAFAALIAAIGYVAYQIVSDNVLPAVWITPDVVSDDMFGTVSFLM